MPVLKGYDALNNFQSISVQAASCDYLSVANISAGTKKMILGGTEFTAGANQTTSSLFTKAFSAPYPVTDSLLYETLMDLCNQFGIMLANANKSIIPFTPDSYRLVPGQANVAPYFGMSCADTSTGSSITVSMEGANPAGGGTTLVQNETAPSGTFQYTGFILPCLFTGVSYSYGDWNVGVVYVENIKRVQNPSVGNCNIYFRLCYGINQNNFTATDPEPGEKGFIPTAATTTRLQPGVGGRGTTNKKNPDYAGDSIQQPGAPDESKASAIGTGFITAYVIDKGNLAKVGECLWGTTLEGFLQGMFVNPLDYIVSLSVFPYEPDAAGSEYIKMGRFLCAVAGGGITQALGVNAYGNPLSSQYKVVDFGTVEIPENWGNFLDYSQTTIELYLPFIGTVNLDVSEAMGGTVNVQYTIDYFTGQCVANVLCSRPNFVLPSGKALSHVHAQHSFQGNCATQIPISRADYGAMVGNLINACTQAITNPVNGFMGIASDAVTGGFRPNVSSKGNIVANAGYCAVLYPYIRITRPITAEPESYQEVMGFPSYINTTLGECDDLCVCDGIDLKGISGATESELDRIRQLCSEGVYV